jgi:hypothetical protein
MARRRSCHRRLTTADSVCSGTKPRRLPGQVVVLSRVVALPMSFNFFARVRRSSFPSGRLANNRMRFISTRPVSETASLPSTTAGSGTPQYQAVHRLELGAVPDETTLRKGGNEPGVGQLFEVKRKRRGRYPKALRNRPGRQPCRRVL